MRFRRWVVFTFAVHVLIIVLDKITNLAGEDREGLTGESFLKRFDVLDQDGQTDDGKPYFRIPAGTSPDLVPQPFPIPLPPGPDPFPIQIRP